MNNPDESKKLKKSEAEWREQLSPEQYRVTREAGTERPHTGEYNLHKDAGVYHCICCKQALFRSNGKFEASCGWPSFFEPFDSLRIEEIEDTSVGMRRVEVRCNKCEAHLGHVFPDGPPPTHLRYCINSVSLGFEAED